MKNNGIGKQIKKPEKKPVAFENLRIQLSNFSDEIKDELLDIFDTWVSLRGQEEIPLTIPLISYLTRELLEFICKFETIDTADANIVVDSDIEIDESSIRQKIANKLSIDKSENKLIWVGLMTENEKKYLLNLSEKQDFRYCVWELFKDCNDLRNGLMVAKFKVLLKKLDPQNEIHDNEKLIQLYKDLRKYFTNLLHLRKEANYNREDFYENLLRVEEILFVIAKDQITIMDEIDQLL